MRWYGFTMGAAAIQVVIAIVCAAWLWREAPAIGGVHPAMKPLKFAISVGVLLASVALVLRALEVRESVKAAIAVTVSSTLLVEMMAIVAQAARGRASHFNVATSGDALIWHVMGGAIVLALVALLVLAAVATVRPLQMDPLLAAAVRIGLWLLLLVAVSGVAMGGRGSHSVGTHGDLRTPHFFAVHGLQALPLCALVLLGLPIGERTRWIVLGIAAVGWIGLALGSLLQAFAGRSLV